MKTSVKGICYSLTLTSFLYTNSTGSFSALKKTNATPKHQSHWSIFRHSPWIPNRLGLAGAITSQPWPYHRYFREAQHSGRSRGTWYQYMVFDKVQIMEWIKIILLFSVELSLSLSLSTWSWWGRRRGRRSLPAVRRGWSPAAGGWGWGSAAPIRGE